MSTRFRFSRIRPVATCARDTSGQVAMTFALSLIPLLLVVGSAIDYARAITARATLQQATDSAALGLVKSASTLSATALKTQLTNYVVAAARDPNATVSGTPTVSSTGQLCFSTSTRVPTTFMRLAGIDSLPLSSKACAINAGGTFEIAMALDNTGSMGTYDYVTGRTKIQNEILAAQNLVNTIFNGQTTSQNYEISIVPFSSSVKVGTQFATAAFVDSKGKSSIHWENFPNASNNSWKPTSRFDLFSAVGTSWGGCFEERPQPYSLSDDPPNPSYPDTLFVPMFAPDEAPSSSQNNYSRPNNNYLPSEGSTSSGGGGRWGGWGGWGGSSSSSQCSVSPDGTNSINFDNGGWTYGDGTKTWGDGQARLCKYKGQSASYNAPGPNWGCDSTLPPIQLLTNSTGPLNSTLQAMRANGTTNLVSGFMWAWRTISPNGPFTSYSTIKPYNYMNSLGATNTKVIVFMTDGYNNWQPSTSNINDGYYSAFGYYHDARLGKLPVTQNGVTMQEYPNANNQREYLDSAFLEACTNAKNAGVQVYTIGFSIPNDPIDQEGINVLKQCASKSDMAYVATDGNQIINIFGTIANGLGSARLTQ